MTSRFTLLIIALAAFAAACSTSAFRRGPAGFSGPLQSEWGDHFVQSMEYIDYPDLLVEIAWAENEPAKHTAPWLRYENGESNLYRELKDAGVKTAVPTLDARWQNAVEASLSGPIDHRLLQLVGQLTQGYMKAFRETPIDDAGGDELKNKEGHGYDRVTLNAVQAVCANPVLVATIHADDGDAQSPDHDCDWLTSQAGHVQTFLLKYRYPSAGTWKKFQNQLSKELVTDLTNADADGLLRYDMKNAASVGPEFRQLNQRIITELLQKAYDSGAQPWQNYQRLISVHPFSDYNGRSLRAWYRHETGRPLFLLDFYCDIYCSARDFGAEVELGAKGLDRILAGLKREDKAHPPGTPDFYSIPEFWLVAAGRTDTPKDLEGLVERSKAFFRNPLLDARVSQKLFDGVLHEYREYTASRFPVVLEAGKQ